MRNIYECGTCGSKILEIRPTPDYTAHVLRCGEGHPVAPSTVEYRIDFRPGPDFGEAATYLRGALDALDEAESKMRQHRESMRALLNRFNRRAPSV